MMLRGSGHLARWRGRVMDSLYIAKSTGPAFVMPSCPIAHFASCSLRSASGLLSMAGRKVGQGHEVSLNQSRSGLTLHDVI